MARRPTTPRPGPRALVLGLAAVLWLVACDGSGDRDEVSAFIERANAVQEEAAPALRRANAAYRRFATGDLAPRDALGALEDSRALIGSLRADVATLEAPPPARRLKALILAVFDAEAELADQTATTARYLAGQSLALAGLGRMGRALRRALRDTTGGPQAQADALSRYADGLRRAVARLRRLDPPVILGAEHRAQVRRLIDARTVALRLRGAILARDQAAVTGLLDRLADVGAQGPDARLSRDARRRYERRLRAVERSQRKAQAEVIRLDRELD